MKRWVMLAILSAIMLVETGCGDGVGYSARERRHRARRVFENDMQQLADDIDVFLLNDKNTRLTRWTVD